jgi:hypothetical protein
MVLGSYTGVAVKSQVCSGYRCGLCKRALVVVASDRPCLLLFFVHFSVSAFYVNVESLSAGGSCSFCELPCRPFAERGGDDVWPRGSLRFRGREANPHPVLDA